MNDEYSSIIDELLDASRIFWADYEVKSRSVDEYIQLMLDKEEELERQQLLNQFFKLEAMSRLQIEHFNLIMGFKDQYWKDGDE